MSKAKNYIGFINDHSGSMQSLRMAAMADFNNLIEAIKESASKEVQDTIVSSFGVGVISYNVAAQLILSNPHVLEPMASWSANGGTPLYDGIGQQIDQFLAVPDYHRKEVSFLVFVTTDGEENGSQKETLSSIKHRIKELQATGRWTFVFRVPKGHRAHIQQLGVSAENIQEWETSTEGMRVSTQSTQAAVSTFFSARSAGQSASGAFYSGTQAVNTAALQDVTSDFKLYVVPADQNGVEIRPFILTYLMEYLKGSAFYQLTKTESRVQHDKQIAIRERSTGKIYCGKDARKMIGLPTDRNVRLHPGDHGNYDVFIQSNSVNRKLVGGTGVLYNKKIGVPFTEADLAYLQPKPMPTKKQATGPVQLPAVTGNTAPTKSPIPVTPRGPTVGGKGVRFYATRDEARAINKGDRTSPVQDVKEWTANGHKVTSNALNQRWFTFNKVI